MYDAKRHYVPDKEEPLSPNMTSEDNRRDATLGNTVRQDENCC